MYHTSAMDSIHRCALKNIKFMQWTVADFSHRVCRYNIPIRYLTSKDKFLAASVIEDKTYVHVRFLCSFLHSAIYCVSLPCPLLSCLRSELRCLLQFMLSARKVPGGLVQASNQCLQSSAAWDPIKEHIAGAAAAGYLLKKPHSRRCWWWWWCRRHPEHPASAGPSAARPPQTSEAGPLDPAPCSP